MHHYLAVLAALFLLISCDSRVDYAVENSASDKKPSYSLTTQFPHGKFAIATAHPLATQAGIKILQQGGNAFDAAVAVTAVLAVVEPYASGLGGGGFWLLHLADEEHNVMVDGREVAPLAATRDMYIGTDGKVTQQSESGPLAAGIPGTPAALAHIAENYGRLALHELLQPAIGLAEQGFAVSEFYSKRATSVVERLNQYPPAAAIFLDQGQAPKPGFILRQPKLAEVLKEIAKSGADGFYRGEVANQLVNAVRKAGGIWHIEDLQGYEVVERQPMVGKYKDMHITSAALPSSGGIVMLQVLNMLAELDLQELNDVQRKHLLIEAMRRAYHDRAKYLGDTDFVDVQVDELISPAYAINKFADFDSQHATASNVLIKAEQNSAAESEMSTQPEDEQAQNTTHFSILDQDGNRVAATLSINYFFGSSFVAQGTGVLLNNEMDDFAIQPGHANLWGLVGAEANSIQAGKRMLSSMSPTFLEDGQRMAILGTPGGSRIISMVLLSALQFMQGASAEQMVQQGRFHHQFLPDVVQYERDAFAETTISGLEAKGHELKKLPRDYGNMQLIVHDYQSNQLSAASDPRGIGLSHVEDE